MTSSPDVEKWYFVDSNSRLPVSNTSGEVELFSTRRAAGYYAQRLPALEGCELRRIMAPPGLWFIPVADMLRVEDSSDHVLPAGGSDRAMAVRFYLVHAASLMPVLGAYNSVELCDTMRQALLARDTDAQRAAGQLPGSYLVREVTAPPDVRWVAPGDILRDIEGCRDRLTPEALARILGMPVVSAPSPVGRGRRTIRIRR